MYCDARSVAWMIRKLLLLSVVFALSFGLLKASYAQSLSALSLTPATVQGSQSSTGTVTLTAAAPTGGKIIALASNSTNATVSSSVTVPAGATSKTFAVSTKKVSNSTSATITASASGIAKTAILTIAPPYLSSFTLSSPSVTAGRSLTGTLTFSLTPVSAVTIALMSSDPSVTLPASVNISAGAKTASVTIYATNVSVPTYVTVSGTCSGWTQAAQLMVLPATYALSVQNFSVMGGNGCVVLSWQDLPGGSIKGYNVYRKLSGGSATKLTPTPFKTNIFADTGTTQAYLYQIAVVGNTGTEIGFSTWTSGTATTTGPTLTWKDAPASTISVTGILVAHATFSTNNAISTTFIVDGEVADMPEDGSEFDATLAGDMRAQWDTSTVANGTHTIQMIGYTQKAVYATLPLSIKTNNNTTSQKHTSVVASDAGNVAYFNATLPSGTTSWQVNLRSPADGSVVQSWQGFGTSVSLALVNNLLKDPLPETGSPARPFPIELIPEPEPAPIPNPGTAPEGPPMIPPTITTRRYRKGSNALALIDYVSLESVRAANIDAKLPDRNNGLPAVGSVDDPDVILEQAVRNAFASLTASDSSIVGTVLGSGKPGDRLIGRDPVLNAAIRAMLGANTTTFYLCGHGSTLYDETAQIRTGPPVAKWGGCLFWSERPSTLNGYLSGITDIIANESWNYYLPQVVGAQQYNFAWIDACESVGGLASNPEKPDMNNIVGSFPTAFNIGFDPAVLSCFVGWTGSVGVSANVYGKQSDMGQWRCEFWKQLGMYGHAVSSAYTKSIANFSSLTGADGYLANRFYRSGDAILP